MTIWIFLNLFRHFNGESWKPLTIGLSAYFPIHDHIKKLLPNVEITLGNGKSFFSVRKEDIFTPKISPVPELPIAFQAPEFDLMFYLRHSVLTLMATGEVTVDKVSLLLGMSSRSLQRELNNRNLVFRDVVCDIKCDEATELLKTTDTPISQIAEHIGYSNSTHFSRAFKRKNRLTPSQYRKQNQNSF